jgi:hypothetical protein
MNILQVSEIKPMWIEEVMNTYVTDAYAQRLIQQLAISSPNEEGYTLHQGVIRKNSQI